MIHRHAFAKKNKYGVGSKAKRTRGAIVFDSIKEARYYDTLCLRVSAGEVVFFLRQVPFHLPGNVTYRIDFQEFLADGTIQFTDVKGMKTPMYIVKKKQVEDLYPITITEV